MLAGQNEEKPKKSTTSTLIQSLSSLVVTEARHEKKKQALIKAKLISAIATEYQNEISRSRGTPPSSSVFLIYFREKITVAAYLNRFTDALENISVTALLHMTIVIDTFFHLKPKEKMTDSNCYGLILSSLCLTHEFNDDDLHDANSFAKLAGITSIQLNDMQERLLSVTGGIQYTSARYHVAWGEYLPTFEPDQPKIEMPEETKRTVCEETSQLSKGDTEKIGLSLVKKLGAVLERLIIRNNWGHETSPFDECIAFYSSRIPVTSLTEYLERLHKYSNAGIETLIRTLMVLDEYLQKEEPRDCFGAWNAHRLILTSFVLAYYSAEDFYHSPQTMAKLGGISVKELEGLEITFLELVPNVILFSPEQFSTYIYALSPDDATALGIPPPSNPMTVVPPEDQRVTYRM